MRQYLWSVSCAWGLTISVVVLGVAGAMAMFLPPGDVLGFSRDQWCVAAFAAMAALSIACANNAAAAAMHAISRAGGWSKWHWPTLAPALICAVGFAVASNVAVHLGWSILAAAAAHPDSLPDTRQVDFAALFLCFAKPAMAWIIEGRKAMDLADYHAAAAAEEERLSASRAADIAARNTNVKRFKPRTVGASGAAALASMAALGTLGTALQAAPQEHMDANRETQAAAPLEQTEAAEQAPQEAPQTRIGRQAMGANARPSVAPQRRSQRQGRRTMEGARADFEARAVEARRLLLEERGLSNREVARRSGVSPASVDRMAQALTPLQAVS